MGCPTWNFCGNIPAAQAALTSTVITRKVCVSKNVCHSVNYDMEWHKALGAAAEAEARTAPEARPAAALGMMYKAMDAYLRNKPGGKKLHDPLALAVALDESVCELAEVQLFCQKGKWGSRLTPGSNVWISIAYDAVKFQTTLLPGQAVEKSSGTTDNESQCFGRTEASMDSEVAPSGNREASKRWQQKGK